MGVSFFPPYLYFFLFCFFVFFFFWFFFFFCFILLVCVTQLYSEYGNFLFDFPSHQLAIAFASAIKL